MKKLLGVDARMWAHPGIGRYVRELSRALLRIAPPDRFLFFGDESLIRPFLGADVSVERAASPIYGLAEQTEMARLSGKVDALHVPHFNVPVFGRRPLIVTLHDLIYLRERGAMKNPLGRLYVKAMLNHVTRHAQAIITVSEATKRDLLDFFPGLDPARIEVTHEAASLAFQPLPDGAGRAAVLCSYRLEKPFVINVGSLKPHKNVPLLILAMQRIRAQNGLDVEAVIVGRADAKHPEIAEKARTGDGIRYLGEVSDEHLVELYNAATALVLPSFREGFGLPVLEAMACGTPVILSRCSSLPEIAAEAGQYFEPDRVDGLCELLYTIFKNQDLRQKMSQACRARAAQFTWERTARKTLAIYDKVLNR